MNSNVLIINPPSKDWNINRDMAGGLGFSGGDGVVLPPLDLLNIASVLKKDKYKIFFIDAIAERFGDEEKIHKYIQTNNIDIIIGNLAIPTIDEDIKFYKNIKKCFLNIKVIIKTGINFNEILKKVLKKSRCDLVIFSECDLNIKKYINGEERSGTVRKIGKKIIITPIRNRIENLDLLPVDIRNSIENRKYKFYLMPGITTTMQTTRGCPFPCGYYCPYPLVQGKKWRFMSPKRVVEEIKEIKNLHIDNILFRDATFTLDQERAKEICKLIIKNKIKVKWWCETRINVLSEELLKIMKKAGCVGINVGVETLDKDLISNEGKPGVRLEDVIRIRKLARRIGIKLHFLMIIGLPDDNVDTLKNTFEYFIKLKPESAGFTLITPYPGTKMFEDALKSNLIKNFDWNSFNGITVTMKTKHLNEFELRLARLLLQIASFVTKRGGLLEKIMINIIRQVFNIWGALKKRS